LPCQEGRLLVVQHGAEHGAEGTEALGMLQRWVGRQEGLGATRWWRSKVKNVSFLFFLIKKTCFFGDSTIVFV
jgi:hypothetical protein